MASSLTTRLGALRERSPQHYSILQRHLPLLQTALNDATRTYPTGRQRYAHLEDPPIPSRTFGCLLALLVDLEIIDIYAERSSANRYGIRGYDATAFNELAALLAETRPLRVQAKLHGPSDSLTDFRLSLHGLPPQVYNSKNVKKTHHSFLLDSHWFCLFFEIAASANK
ncbi:hypothetical protein SAMN04487950_3867 [Halogranum rubrum]|uniref:Uncharacterized protein n=1 Tax=Halogranum rubrum TaxID=553466 RepID=A0A1I4HXN1_9EURY|nr:hypothetical protein SAMN04487950_3867 [Halogranum rubrum]